MILVRKVVAKMRLIFYPPLLTVFGEENKLPLEAEYSL